MLVRTGRMRIADCDLLSIGDGSYTVRNDTVCCKISAADHVSGSCRRYCDPKLLKKSFLVTVCHQFRTGFAVGVRIIAVQFIGLSVSPFPFVISIYFVGCHIQKRFYTFALSHCFQNVHCSHNIGFVGVYGIFVRFSHDRLCSQMKYDLRLCLGKNLLHFLQITDISCDRMHLRFHIQKLKKIWLRRRLQCISGDFRAKLQKKSAEPGALKACMPGHENLFSFIKTEIKCIHRFSPFVIMPATVFQA